MRGNRRRLTGAIAAIAAVTALTACASDSVDAAPAAPAASASPAPPPVEEFCAAILAVDTAALESDGGGGEEEPAAHEEGAAHEESGSASEADASASPEASTESEPTATTAPASIAPASFQAPAAPAGDLPSPDPSAAAEPGGPSEGGPSDSEIAAEKARFDPLLAEIERTKPAAVAAEVETLLRLARQAFSTGDYSLFESEEWAAADAKVDEFMLAECGYSQLSVTGADYEFTGIPATVKAGPTGVTLTNEGEEFHVVLLLRFNDGETLSVEDLLKLDEAAAMTKTTLIADSFAPPGATGTAFFDLTPGRYVAICPIPKGAKPGVEEPDGPPHFTEGMVEEFTVS